MYPTSCDTFVALPPSTEGQRIVFGKNSDRPCDEVQEVVYFPAKKHETEEKVEVSRKQLYFLPRASNECSVHLIGLIIKLKSTMSEIDYSIILFVMWSVYLYRDRAGGSDICSGAESSRLAVGGRDGGKRASGVHRERGGVGERECGRWRGSPGHGSRQVIQETIFPLSISYSASTDNIQLV